MPSSVTNLAVHWVSCEHTLCATTYAMATSTGFVVTVYDFEDGLINLTITNVNHVVLHIDNAKLYIKTATGQTAGNAERCTVYVVYAVAACVVCVVVHFPRRVF